MSPKNAATNHDSAIRWSTVVLEDGSEAINGTIAVDFPSTFTVTDTSTTQVRVCLSISNPFFRSSTSDKEFENVRFVVPEWQYLDISNVTVYRQKQAFTLTAANEPPVANGNNYDWCRKDYYEITGEVNADWLITAVYYDEVDKKLLVDFSRPLKTATVGDLEFVKNVDYSVYLNSFTHPKTCTSATCDSKESDVEDTKMQGHTWDSPTTIKILDNALTLGVSTIAVAASLALNL